MKFIVVLLQMCSQPLGSGFLSVLSLRLQVRKLVSFLSQWLLFGSVLLFFCSVLRQGLSTMQLWLCPRLASNSKDPPTSASWVHAGLLLFEMGSCYIAQAGFEFTLLLQLLKHQTKGVSGLNMTIGRSYGYQGGGSVYAHTGYTPPSFTHPNSSPKLPCRFCLGNRLLFVPNLPVSEEHPSSTHSGSHCVSCFLMKPVPWN